MAAQTPIKLQFLNTVAPVVSGTATVGQTLSTTNGTWTGAPAPTFTYQWQRVTTNISGATSSTYVLVVADVGNTIRCVVTATNAIAPSGVTANSNSTAAVAATVPGAPTIGTATATGLTTATVSYTAPASNGGATITLYTATSSPGGLTGTLAQAGSGTITVSGLTTNTAYTFTVKATNSIGQSAASAASNSVTPVAAGFLATEVYTGNPNNNRSVNLAVSSGGTIYKIPNGDGFPSGTSLINYTSTGTQTWNRRGYIGTGNVLSDAVDASNNYYALGERSAGTPQISKFNSSDTLQWSTSFYLGNNRSVNSVTRPVIDSSGNVYFGFRRYEPNCCCGQYLPFTQAFNSSGTVISSSAVQYESGGNTYAQQLGVGVDGSNNLYYAITYRQSNQNSVIVYKLNTSSALVANVVHVPSSGNYDGYDYVFDTANSVGYWSGTYTSVGNITKHNTSLAISWSYNFTNCVYLAGVAVDSSGNVYGAGISANGASSSLVIVKLNSSGTLQWARSLAVTSYRALDTKIAVSGTKFTVSYTIDGADTRAATFSAPTDGSGTGTISNASLSWVYAVHTTSLTSVAYTSSTAGSITNRDATSPTSQTPTIVTSSWTSTTTQF